MSNRTIAQNYLSVSGVLKPIYAIKNHNVNIRELTTESKLRINKFRVVYKLGNRDAEIVSMYLEATDDYRTLIFSNPTDSTRTIGIPIMNVISCERIN
jgi:hypothetical protein